MVSRYDNTPETEEHVKALITSELTPVFEFGQWWIQATVGTQRIILSVVDVGLSGRLDVRVVP